MEAELRAGIARLHSVAPDSIGDQFRFELLEWGEKGCLLRCETAQWMGNAYGTLHGGMSAAIADQAMGFLAYAVRQGEGITPTVQMQTLYHRPISPGKKVLVRVQVVEQTRVLTHLSCQLMMEEAPDILCVSASSIYYFAAAKK